MASNLLAMATYFEAHFLAFTYFGGDERERPLSGHLAPFSRGRPAIAFSPSVAADGAEGVRKDSTLRAPLLVAIS